MLKVFLTSSLLATGLLLQACNQAEADTSRLQPEPPIESLPANQTVNFKGVSFKYNPQIFGKVKPEQVAERPLESKNGKGDYVTPKQIRFVFDLTKPFDTANIAVSLVDDFPRMFAVDKPTMKTVNGEIVNLRRVLKDKNFRSNNEIPYLLSMDASQEFQSKVKYVPFKSGKGIVFITHWMTEAALISNEHLEYVFEGLTDDGKYYIWATMPISISFLPKSSPEEFEEYKRSYLFEDYPHPNEIKKRYKDYVSSISRRIENSEPEKFQPNLNYFEEILSTLKVEK